MRIFAKRPIKLLIAFIATCIICIGFISIKTWADTDFYIFHDNPCESCHEGERILSELDKHISNQTVRSNINPEIYFIYQTSGGAKLDEVLNKIGLARKDVNYPLIVYGESYFMGEEGIDDAGIYVNENFKEQKTSSDDRTDIVSEEDTEKKNEVKANKNGNTEQQIDEIEWKKDNNNIYIRYFKTEACTDCEKAYESIKSLPDEIERSGEKIKIKVDEINISKDNNSEMLTNFFEIYQVDEAKQQVPIVFVGKRYLSGQKDIRAGIEKAIHDESSRYYIDKDQVKTGKSNSSTKSESSSSTASSQAGLGFSIWKTIGTGVINGFNPCALSMTLLFLSLLVGLESKKLFRAAGLAYIIGKFTAYLIIGVLVSFLIQSIPFTSFSVFRKILLYVLVTVCLVLAIGNFVDFYYVLQKQYGKIRMQLPKSLRGFTEKIIKSSVDKKYGRWLVLIVLICSMGVAVGEFFCTGQIYLTSILSTIQHDQANSLPLLYFIVYVGALCLPSLALFIVSNLGKNIFNLSKLSVKALPYIKLFSGLLFVAIALFAIL